MLQALETRYAGRRFRSRREARWAVLLDQLKIEWRFEPEGYELEPGLCYLPDFEVQPTTGEGGWIWLEVKPELERYRQLELLCLQSKRPGFVVAEPSTRATVLPCSLGGLWGPEISVEAMLLQLGITDRLTLQAASNAALSARWEHGEQPRRPRKPGGRGPRAYQRAEGLLDRAPDRDWGF